LTQQVKNTDCAEHRVKSPFQTWKKKYHHNWAREHDHNPNGTGTTKGQRKSRRLVGTSKRGDKERGCGPDVHRGGGRLGGNQPWGPEKNPTPTKLEDSTKNGISTASGED